MSQDLFERSAFRWAVAEAGYEWVNARFATGTSAESKADVIAKGDQVRRLPPCATSAVISLISRGAVVIDSRVWAIRISLLSTGRIWGAPNPSAKFSWGKFCIMMRNSPV